MPMYTATTNAGAAAAAAAGTTGALAGVLRHGTGASSTVSASGRPECCARPLTTSSAALVLGVTSQWMSRNPDIHWMTAFSADRFSIIPATGEMHSRSEEHTSELQP